MATSIHRRAGGGRDANIRRTDRLASAARAVGPGHVIVTMLCDSGLRYRQRLFNREFLAARGLALPDWLNLDA